MTTPVWTKRYSLQGPALLLYHKFERLPLTSFRRLREWRQRGFSEKHLRGSAPTAVVNLGMLHVRLLRQRLSSGEHFGASDLCVVPTSGNELASYYAQRAADSPSMIRKVSHALDGDW